MKFNEQWLREWVDPEIPSGELAERLTMAGLEVESAAPAAGDFSGVTVAEIAACEPHPQADRLQVCRVRTGGGDSGGKGGSGKNGKGAGGGKRNSGGKAGADAAQAAQAEAQIVCGAPNARPGLKAPLARIGARLPGGAKIGKAKLRGVESQGMLCSGAELGLGGDAGGLLELPEDAPLGEDLRRYLHCDDRIFELALTPNRPDCLGLRGVAREVGLLTGAPVREPAIPPVPAVIKDTFPVKLAAGDACPRFAARVIRGIDLSRPSPLWLRERLRRAGLRALDAAVDITNYVMLELGQPMHAFDLDKLEGGIEVRYARPGEPLELLNGQTVKLREDTVVVADAAGAVSIAGVMGGARTAVSESTVNVLLEAAWWKPAALAGRARRYGLHTDASHRFERGADYGMQEQVIERATALLLEFCGGDAGPLVDTANPADLPRRPKVRLRRERILRVLGMEIDDAEVERILNGLGCEVRAAKDGWDIEAPTWRPDLAIEADYMEELARIRGYHRLPAHPIRAELRIRRQPERRLPLRRLRRQLAAREYQEAITYSFVDPARQKDFDPNVPPAPLSNPMSSDSSVMRTSLLPGLMGAVVHNLSRQQERVRLFETGLRFLPKDAVAARLENCPESEKAYWRFLVRDEGFFLAEENLRQVPTLAGVAIGRRAPESWADSGEGANFHDLKGDIEALLTASGRSIRFASGERPGFHPGQTAFIYWGDDGKAPPIGVAGALHPDLQAAYEEAGAPQADDKTAGAPVTDAEKTGDAAAPICLFEIDLGAVLQASLPEFAELSRYPSQRRDLSALLDKSVPAAAVLECARNAAGGMLTDINLFDVYEQDAAAAERSLGLGLTFRSSSRTLTREEVDKAFDQVIASLEKTFGAKIRGRQQTQRGG